MSIRHRQSDGAFFACEQKWRKPFCDRCNPFAKLTAQASGLTRTSRRGRGRRSAGYSMMEMIILLTLLSSVMAGVVGLMSVVRDGDQTAAENFLMRNEIRRLADDLRRDVRSTGRSDLLDSTLTLADLSGERKIVYQVESDSVVTRTLTEKSSSEKSRSNVSRDRYQIGKDLRVAIQLGQQKQIVQWTITPQNQAVPPIEIVSARRKQE